MDNRDFEQRMQRIEALVHELEGAPDPKLRADARELASALMEVHGAALDRLLDMVRASGEAGAALSDRLCGDDLVSSVLLLHGLHPVPFETRVRCAIDEIGGVLRKSGAQVDIMGIEDGAIHLRLSSTEPAGACGSSRGAARQRVEDALYRAAPDLTGLEIEEPTESAVQVGFVPLEKLTRRKAGADERREGLPV